GFTEATDRDDSAWRCRRVRIDRAANALRKAVLQIRLQKHLPYPGRGGFRLDVFVRVTGNQDDRGDDIQSAESGSKLQSVDSRHFVVHDEAIRPVAGGRPKQRRPAAEGADLEILGLQKKLQRPQHVVIVVDHVN